MISLITGANGFVGSHLHSYLRSIGDEVVALDRNNGPDLLNFEAFKKHLQTIKPNIIYHLAGWSNVATSWENPIACFQTNSTGTLTLLESARLADVKKVIFISSADVYTKNQDNRLLSENAPIEPDSPYGVSKQAAESIAKQYWKSHELEIVIARPFNHIGPGQANGFVTSSFANRIAVLEKQGGGTLEHGNISAERDFTDVRDVVRSYKLLAEHGKPGEIYNVCSQTPTSIELVLEKMLKLSPAKISTKVNADLLRPVDCPRRVGSNEKIREATGWTPVIPLDQSLQDVLNEKRITPNTVKSSHFTVPESRISPTQQHPEEEQWQKKR